MGMDLNLVAAGIAYRLERNQQETADEVANY